MTYQVKLETWKEKIANNIDTCCSRASCSALNMSEDRFYSADSKAATLESTNHHNHTEGNNLYWIFSFSLSGMITGPQSTHTSGKSWVGSARLDFQGDHK